MSISLFNHFDVLNEESESELQKYELNIEGFEELINKIPLLPDLFSYTNSEKCGYLTLKGGLMRFICESVYQCGKLPDHQELFDYIFNHDIDLKLHTGYHFQPLKFITYCISRGATVEYVGREYVPFTENNRFELPEQPQFTFDELKSGYYNVWFPYQEKFIKFDVHINNYTTAFMESDFYINDISAIFREGEFEISYGFIEEEKIITQLKRKIMRLNKDFFRTNQSHLKVIYRAIQFYKRGYHFDKKWLIKEANRCIRIIKQAKTPYALYFSNSKTPTQGTQIKEIIKSCKLEKIVLTEKHFSI
jgi:hypothetical protein